MKRQANFIFIVFPCLAVFLFLFAGSADASAIGTIDDTNKYAWGENIGWLNFGLTAGNVRISDTEISGYAWSSNYGWINLSPTTGGVLNNGAGTLSGHAWGENLGWIDFSGVTINSAGEFMGYAMVENSNSRISLNCANTSSCSASDFKVKTDWTPSQAVSAGSPAVPSSGTVNLLIAAPPASQTATITPPLVEKETEITVEIKTEKIEPPIGKSPVTEPASAKESVFRKLAKILSPLFSKLAPPKPIAPAEVPLAKLVPRAAPPALFARWELIEPAPVKRFVFAPLPKEFIKLADKFPSLDKIFKEINISKVSDINRLSSVALNLPGLTERAGLPKAELGAGDLTGSAGLPKTGLKPGKLALPRGLPLTGLTTEMKKNLPPEIIFARAGNELVDYKLDLTINNQGRPQLKINALANQELKLVVKPDGPVDSVKGYLVFKSADYQATGIKPDVLSSLISPALASGINEEIYSFSVGLQDFLSSLIFARPSLAAKQEIPVPVEEKLVLQEFDYADGDGDGLWTAVITTPANAGQYEVITVLYYKDPELGARAIKLTTVIDPEGYIYEKFQDKELRVPGAIATLFRLNDETSRYDAWPAEEYNQKNPQITDLSGKYSFLVPPGTYYLKVEAPGYRDYDGKPFIVSAGGGVHANIELKSAYGWLKNMDWKTILLILVAIFLAYNFYKDKLRSRHEQNQ